MTNRRSFPIAAGLGLAAVSVSRLADASSSPAIENKAGPEIKLGAASHSVREFTREQAFEYAKAAEFEMIIGFPAHEMLESLGYVNGILSSI